MSGYIYPRPLVSLSIFLLLSFNFYAAIPGSGTLMPSSSGGASSISWTGGPYTAVTPDPSLCNSLSCDDYFLTIDIPASFYTNNPDFSVSVSISWSTQPNDFDFYVYDSNETLVNSSAQGNTTFEYADLGQLTSGTYHVQVVAFSTVNESYSGTASVGPPPVDQERHAKYKNGNFTFSQAQVLLGTNGIVFGVQGLEPRSAFDSEGNIYVAAIEGIPAGTDIWKSTDGGSTFTFLGQPDAAQAAAVLAGRTPGPGGGDEDLAVGSNGRVYMASLWLGSVTMCNSTDGGMTWIANPYSTTVPLVDRQWIASYQDNIVYLTFKQLGVLLTGTESIFVLKSFDGGITFPQITEATLPEFNVQPDNQGNIVVNQDNGNVFTVFIGHPGNSVYIARSTDGGLSFVDLPVHQGPSGESYQNVFPIIALDLEGNLHVVYSNGSNIFLTSSTDQGNTWNKPVRLNNGSETKTGIAPWIDAGDAGKVDVMWWATSSSNSLSESAQWKVYFAQIRNAFSNRPRIDENSATGVFHTGPICVNGTGCESGTRDLAEYASLTVYMDGNAMIVYPDNQQTSNPLTYFTKQNSGSVIISSGGNHQNKIAGQSSDIKEFNFALEQNYPNPFNPETKIIYSIPRSEVVKLSVYNILGENVKTLVDGSEGAGIHTLIMNAADLPGGIYLYRLSAGNYVSVRKMILMK